MRTTVTAALAASIVLGGAGAAFAEGDAKKGLKVFNRCKACHVIDKEQNRNGPHLVGIYGRTPGSVESYADKYSDGLKAYGEENEAWTTENLTVYLAGPKDLIDGSRMSFRLRKDSDIANVIAYLKEESEKAEGS